MRHVLSIVFILIIIFTISTPTQANTLLFFQNYRSQKEHHLSLLTVLGPWSSRFGFSSWAIIPRYNQATRFPTDFVSVRVSDGVSEQLLELLQRSRLVKSSSLDRQFTAEALKQHSSDEVFDAYDQFIGTDSCDSDVGNFERPQRFHFPSEFLSEHSDDSIHQPPLSPSPHQHRRLLAESHSVTSALGADFIWNSGFRGRGVRVAVFDTGLAEKHPHFHRIEDRTNWTNEKQLGDRIGHGTFVAGVIASHGQCPGFAPDASLFIFRVFSQKQTSFTSWFLDAFNYAIFVKVNILNLSIGGPDFKDVPFADKINEMSANNIIVISAIGNDGPLYGTLNTPADQLDVIGVGGVDSHHEIAHFSSRGMTTWELPGGYGRVKPDVVTYSKELRSSHLNGGCRLLSGTSVACPVVTGAVALLASTINVSSRWDILNPASVKQILVESAERLPDVRMFEQGMGEMDLLHAFHTLKSYEPHASVIPHGIDFTNCPYMWPYCTQPLYADAMPAIVNFTVLNPFCVSSQFAATPLWYPADESDVLSMRFEYPSWIWPWNGHLAVFISVAQNVTQEIIVKGRIVFQLKSPCKRDAGVSIPVTVRVIPTPPRANRILWDQFHSLRYPSGYFPRDNLDVHNDPLDWNADHIHTNFHALYDHLRSKGYFIEVLGTDFTCFDASSYGSLLLVDPEEEFFEEEIVKLTNDIEHSGLSLIVFADWYEAKTMDKIKFFDDNTAKLWFPATGGANVPALNDLLAPFGISFGNRVWKGQITFGSNIAQFASGTSIVDFPAYSYLLFANLRDAVNELVFGMLSVPILGMHYVKRPNSSGGRIAVYGDSNCLDMSHHTTDYCFWLIEMMLDFCSHNKLQSDVWDKHQIFQPHHSNIASTPLRVERSDLHRYSNVIAPHNNPRCAPSMHFNRMERIGRNLSFLEPNIIFDSSETDSDSLIPLVYAFSALILFVFAFSCYRWRSKRQRISARQPSSSIVFPTVVREH